ncbi:MAG: DUF4175 family protein [Bacteroidia bacterium]|nr:DUF4175 family protein [Bacteroidia bacterium]
MNNNRQLLDQRIEEFRRKYYVDKIVRGSLILALLMSSMLFVALLSEGIFGFPPGVRTAMVLTLGAAFLGVLGYSVLWPVSQLMGWAKNLSEFQIAQLVKSYFPDINDKLINLLQLRRQGGGSLAEAAIERKAADIAPVRLANAINLRVNRKYLWYLAVPLLLFLLTYAVDPALLSAGSYRLLNYRKAFVPPPPFQISVDGIPGEVVAGQDLKLQVEVSGSALPAELFLYIKEQDAQNFLDYSLTRNSASSFSYTITGVKSDFSFYVGNPDARTEAYAVKVLKRPAIKSFRVIVHPPAYTGLAPEILQDNVGDIKVLRGSSVTWELLPQGPVEAASLIQTDGKAWTFGEGSREGQLSVAQRLMEDIEYYISLSGEEAIRNIDTVHYRAAVTPDRFPTVYVTSPAGEFQVGVDPVVPLDLELADDFGFTRMGLYYRFTKSGGASEAGKEYREMPLNLEPRTLLQSQSYQIDLSSIGFREGDEAEFFVKVWDNDGISGPKAAVSAPFKIIYPTLDARYDELTSQQDQVQSSLESMEQNARELEEAYRKLQEKMLSQRKLSFDDRKEVQEALEAQQELMQQMAETQKQFEQTKNELQQNQMVSENTLRNYEDLNKLMEEMKDPELEKLLQEIQEKMETVNTDELRMKMEQLQMKQEELRKSLERTLELLKQLEVQQKVDEIRNKLDNLKAKQDILNEKLEEAQNKEALDNLSEKQDALKEQMEQIGQDLEKLSDLKEDTKTPDSDAMEQLQEQGEQAEQEMQEASEQMEQAGEQQESGTRQEQKQSQQSKQNASQKQQKASERMSEMSEMLGNMQMQSQSSQDQENLEDLRALLENLLKLSFDQEDLRDEVRKLRDGDPAYVDKSQQQKKLQDDMGLVKDSLEALAERVFQIQKFVLDESGNIVQQMDESQAYFRNKQGGLVARHQQMAMTSINNLANMLSDVMKQMQEQMKNAQQGQGMCQKPQGQQPNMQGVSRQQQQLNQQMQQMMDGQQIDMNKLSEMAQQQESIRQQLQQLHEQIQQSGGKSLGDMNQIAKDMQDTEEELRNKQLTHETMKRQQQILNRLLQADKSMREQDMDNQRESRTGREIGQRTPDELEREAYKQKIRQELLKSNKLEYSSDFLILIEQYFKTLEGGDE